jgi:ABC-type nitrate/sulfonate/bicarbonate transport system substrate-binding protein
MNNAYIVTENTNKLDSIKDLEGQNVLGFGQTGIPGSVLKTLYTNNDLDQSLIDFSQASSSAVYSLFAGGSTNAKYALMSEPEISKLVLNDKKEVKSLDLTKELGVDVPQACIYVNPNSENQEDIARVLALISDNIKSLNDNPSAYADKVIPLDRVFEGMGKDVIVRSIPLTNIEYKVAKDNKEAINAILSVLGVGSPKDEFYYQG